jgi:hypothetical protein
MRGARPLQSRWPVCSPIEVTLGDENVELYGAP